MAAATKSDDKNPYDEGAEAAPAGGNLSLSTPKLRRHHQPLRTFVPSWSCLKKY
jgi:hypothetical protein